MKRLRDADERDAEYLACQMHTNSRVLGYQTRMQSARDRLHGIYLEVATAGGMPPIMERRRPTEVPLPAIDRTVSTPRLRSLPYQGPAIGADAARGRAAPTSDPPAGMYAFVAPRERRKTS